MHAGFTGYDIDKLVNPLAEDLIKLLEKDLKNDIK
jgi:hypothetical protein